MTWEKLARSRSNPLPSSWCCVLTFKDHTPMRLWTATMMYLKIPVCLAMLLLWRPRLHVSKKRLGFRTYPDLNLVLAVDILNQSNDNEYGVVRLSKVSANITSPLSRTLNSMLLAWTCLHVTSVLLDQDGGRSNSYLSGLWQRNNKHEVAIHLGLTSKPCWWIHGELDCYWRQLKRHQIHSAP